MAHYRPARGAAASRPCQVGSAPSANNWPRNLGPRFFCPDLSSRPGRRDIGATGTLLAKRTVRAILPDRAINNTSIVFVLKIGTASLLFPGDAQWGVWRDIIDDPTATQLLADINLYKVSHHGSHHGSPRSLIEKKLPNKVTSMMSVQHVDEWPNIPKPNLVDALKHAPHKLIRTDVDRAQRPAHRGPDGLWIELTVAS